MSHPVKVAAWRVEQEWMEWRRTNSRSSALIVTVRFSSAPPAAAALQPLLHQVLPEDIREDLFGLSAPRLFTVICSLMTERSRLGALFRMRYVKARHGTA